MSYEMETRTQTLSNLGPSHCLLPDEPALHLHETSTSGKVPVLLSNTELHRKEGREMKSFSPKGRFFWGHNFDLFKSTKKHRLHFLTAVKNY